MSFVTLWNTASRPNWAPTPWSKELDHFFGESASELVAASSASFKPAADLEETQTHYQLDLDLPGLKKEEIQIEVRDNRLHIAGERKAEKNPKLVSERSFGRFERVWALPDDVDSEKVEAGYLDGVLHLQIAKTAAAKPRVIAIRDGQQP